MTAPHGAPQPWQPGPPPPPVTPPAASSAPAPTGASGPPALGHTALGVGIGAVALGIVTTIVFFLMMGGAAPAELLETLRVLTTIVGLGGIALGIYAASKRRGRRPAVIGIILSALGLAIPVVVHVGYTVYVLIAVSPHFFS